MLAKLIVALVAAAGLGSTGAYFTHADGNCPLAAASADCGCACDGSCCPGPCCEAVSCCPGDCCVPGAPCCETTKVVAVKASCCEAGAECCDVAGPCCASK
jgi:hypothetical protein